MLNAYKNQLRILAIDPDQSFHARVKARVGKRATRILEQRLKKFVLMSAGIVKRTYEIWAATRSPLRAKKLGGFLLTYMYHPDDLIPEDGKSLFGYLDDAYLAASVYRSVLDEIKICGGTWAAQDRALYEELDVLMPAVVKVIPSEARQIEAMVQEIQQGKNARFNALFN